MQRVACCTPRAGFIAPVLRLSLHCNWHVVPLVVLKLLAALLCLHITTG